MMRREKIALAWMGFVFGGIRGKKIRLCCRFAGNHELFFFRLGCRKPFYGIYSYMVLISPMSMFEFDESLTRKLFGAFLGVPLLLDCGFLRKSSGSTWEFSL